MAFPMKKRAVKSSSFRPVRDGVDLNALTERLGQMGIDSVLLEGGSTLNWSALNQGIVNRVQAYISPGLFGAQPPKHLWEAEGWNSHTRAFPGKDQITVLDQDILIEGELMPCSQES